MSILRSGVVGNIALNQIQEQRQMISEKWGEMGLLEGLEGHIRDNVAQLFENQAAHMLRESTSTEGSNGSYETVAFPIVRRMFSKLLANDIVSVQALNMPIGKLFFMNPKISKGANKYEDANGRIQPEFEERSLYDAYYAGTDFYGEDAGLFDRSKGRAEVKAVAANDVTFTLKDGGKSALVTIKGFDISDAGKLRDAEGNIMDTEAFLSSLTVKSVSAFNTGSGTTDVVPVGGFLPFHLKPQQYTKGIMNTAGEVVLDVDLSTPVAGGYGSLSKGATAIGKADLAISYKVYAKLEQESEMAEVTFKIEEVNIATKTRKMRASWTPEVAKDVSVFQNIDAEAELTTLLSEQLAAEIDREILRDLRNGAAWSARWDYNAAKTSVNQYHGTQKDHNQTLITKINQIAAQINKATLRGGISWIVVSAEVSAVLDDLEYFHVSNASAEENRYNMGIEKIGTLSGRYIVYKDNFAPPATILVGHKGSSLLESGYIYAPYVPMQLTPVLTDFRDFTSVRGIITRYAKKMVNNRYYGVVKVDNLQTFDMYLS